MMGDRPEGTVPSELLAYQREVFEVIFAPEPDATLAARLPGGAERWLMYRRMVRKRLTRVIGDALPRWSEAAGEEGAAEARAAFFDARALSSRFFRDIPVLFGRWLRPQLDGNTRACLDLDLAIWETRNAAAPLPTFTPFDFEAPVVLHPAVKLLWTTVHPARSDEHFDEERLVCVYRDVRSDATRWLLPEDRAAALLEAWSDGKSAAVQAARSVAERFRMPIDGEFARWLGGCAEDWLERGIVLGSK